MNDERRMPDDEKLAHWNIFALDVYRLAEVGASRTET